MTLDAFIARYGEIRALERGQHLFRQGDRDPPCCLLQTGLLKAYYLTAEGKEAIKSFFVSDTIVGSLRAAFESIPSPYGVIALEPCSLINLPLTALRETARTDLELANVLLEMLIALAIKKERREHGFLLHSAEENYRQLQREVPDLLARVTQNDIAHFLGITPVALSRIRGRMHATNRSSGA